MDACVCIHISLYKGECLFVPYMYTNKKYMCELTVHKVMHARNSFFVRFS